MPRRPRNRCICAYPENWSFSPDEPSSDLVVMTLDEYETIRLIDKEGFTQEECAKSMGVARTTVTAIYDSARRKLAQALVDGIRLQICGGIGMGAQMALAEAGVKLYGGVQGDADEAAKAFAEGRLDYDPEARCDHHGHGEAHECGHGSKECGHGSCHQ